uniref:Protein kinase domain-containing protein n=1 Tax=Panagrolaimus sp. JU765 TaxID=591449 RepID=A0AC34R809_9BILA
MADALVELENGTEIDGWIVHKLLGKGGFGAVYTVQKGDQVHAMKTEVKSDSTKLLKMEVYVMRQLNQAGARHFVTCIDSGIYKDQFSYVVMTMIGVSLQDVRKMCVGQKFSLGTAIYVGIQSLEAIEEMHNVGYLHRDIKPSNYALGKDDLNKIYLLDFGMCRKYLDEQAQPRLPRVSVGFRGTVRYAPLSCHIRRETCRKDDMESWLYQQIEITRGALPWRSIDDRNEVAMYKERCRYGINLQEMMGGCPREYIEILRYIDSIRYYDIPNYKKIYKLLEQAIKNLKLKLHPLDWFHFPALQPNKKP